MVLFLRRCCSRRLFIPTRQVSRKNPKSEALTVIISIVETASVLATFYYLTNIFGLQKSFHLFLNAYSSLLYVYYILGCIFCTCLRLKTPVITLTIY